MAKPSLPPRRRWLRIGLRIAVVAFAALGIWLGGQIGWIRDRHALTAKQANLAEEARKGRFGSVVTQGHMIRGRSGWSSRRVVLWLLGEPTLSDVHLVLFEDQPDLQNRELGEAEGLFPEAANLYWQGYRREAKPDS